MENKLINSGQNNIMDNYVESRDISRVRERFYEDKLI